MRNLKRPYGSETSSEPVMPNKNCFLHLKLGKLDKPIDFKVAIFTVCAIAANKVNRESKENSSLVKNSPKKLTPMRQHTMSLRDHEGANHPDISVYDIPEDLGGYADVDFDNSIALLRAFASVVCRLRDKKYIINQGKNYDVNHEKALEISIEDFQSQLQSIDNEKAPLCFSLKESITKSSFNNIELSVFNQPYSELCSNKTALDSASHVFSESRILLAPGRINKTSLFVPRTLFKNGRNRSRTRIIESGTKTLGP